MLLPAAAVVTNLLFRNSPNLRDGLTLGAAIATFIVVLNILATCREYHYCYVCLT